MRRIGRAALLSLHFGSFLPKGSGKSGQQPEANVTPSEQTSQPFKAALWMLGAIASFTLMAIAGRAVSVELDTFELMMYRSFIGIAIVLSIGAMLGTLKDVQTANLKLHLFRNLSHFAGQNLWFAALVMIPLAQVVALEFTSPISGLRARRFSPNC